MKIQQKIRHWPSWLNRQVAEMWLDKGDDT